MSVQETIYISRINAIKKCIEKDYEKELLNTNNSKYNTYSDEELEDYIEEHFNNYKIINHNDN